MNLSVCRATRAGRVAALAVAAALVATAAQASRTRTVNLEEMSQRAGRIFSGTCLEIRVERDPALGIDVSVVRFRTDRIVKGRRDRTVTVRMAGTTPGAPGTDVVGMPPFRIGEEVVLFLYGESRAGLTSPIGLGQGKFTLVTGEDGRRYAENGRGNQDLFRGLTQDGARRLQALGRGPEGEAAPGTARAGRLPLETLLDYAAALTK